MVKLCRVWNDLRNEDLWNEANYCSRPDLSAFAPLTEDGPQEEQVYENLLGPARHFIESLDLYDLWASFPPDFSIVCAGHSLGASVACVVGLLLRRKFPEWHDRLRCLCVAPMGCTVTEPLVPETQIFVLTVVTKFDGAPAYRYQSACVMRNAWCDCLETCRFSKQDIMALESENEYTVKKTRRELGQKLWAFYHQVNTNTWVPLSAYNVLRNRVLVEKSYVKHTENRAAEGNIFSRESADPERVQTRPVVLAKAMTYDSSSSASAAPGPSADFFQVMRNSAAVRGRSAGGPSKESVALEKKLESIEQEASAEYRPGQGVADTEKSDTITEFAPFEFFMLPYSFLSVGM